MSGPPRRVLAIQREDRFEAARGVLVASLERGHRADGFFRSPGVAGRHYGRDCTLGWAGGAHARRVILTTRIRCGESWSARSRNRLLQWFGLKFLVVRGQETPDGFQLERLLRDFGVDRLWGGDGLIRARARWDPDQPDPERLLKILERLHRLALEIEGVMVPREEDGGELLCPYCRSSISEEGALARCDSCYTPHHPTCFEENLGCALLGCENRTARTRSGRYPRKKVAFEDPSSEPAETSPSDGIGLLAEAEEPKLGEPMEEPVEVGEPLEEPVEDEDEHEHEQPEDEDESGSSQARLEPPL